MQTRGRKRPPYSNTADVFEVLCVNMSSCDEQGVREEKKENEKEGSDAVGDAAAQAGFINTDWFLRVPTQTCSSCTHTAICLPKRYKC